MSYIGPAPNPGQNREVDDISSGFNGSTTAFTLQVNSQNVSPGSPNAYSCFSWWCSTESINRL